MKNYLYTLLTSAVILVLDVVSKTFIVDYFETGGSVDYLNGFLRIALVYNQGGVFGIFQGKKMFFLVLSIIVLIFMIIYYVLEKHKSRLFNTSMAMIIGGAVGNIIDRLIPGRPGVVDFISVGVDGFYRWPSFNVADSSIVVGAFLLAVIFIREERRRKSQGAVNQ